MRKSREFITEPHRKLCIGTDRSEESGKYFPANNCFRAFWLLYLKRKSQQTCCVNTSRDMLLVTQSQQEVKKAAATQFFVVITGSEQVLKELTGNLVYHVDTFLYSWPMGNSKTI